MELDIDDALAELGLTSDATASEVKSAWRRLVSQWHPDRNGNATAVARMQRINRAVEAIRQAGPRPTGAGPDPVRPASSQRRSSRAQPSPAADKAEADRAGEAEAGKTSAEQAPETAARTVHRKVRLTLEEAATGCTKLLRGKLGGTCSACEGAGFRVLGGFCSSCQGSGALRQRSWFGWIGTQAECDACQGGGIARQPCADCAGSGKCAPQPYEVRVRIPHGVRSGDLLSVPAGPGKPGAPPFSLNIRVEVSDHAFLQLDPDGTLRCEVPVDGFAWMANRPVEVPTLDGPQTIQLQRGQTSFRLSAQGFPVERRGRRGDQLITISPVFPQNLSADQQILLDQLIATHSGRDAGLPDPQLRAWQEAMRTWRQDDQRRR